MAKRLLHPLTRYAVLQAPDAGDRSLVATRAPRSKPLMPIRQVGAGTRISPSHRSGCTACTVADDPEAADRLDRAR